MPGSITNDDELAWFGDWVDQRMTLTLTFARPISAEKMFHAFGADSQSAQPLSYEQSADFMSPTPSVSRPLAPRALELLKRSGTSPERIRELSTGQAPAPPGPPVRVGEFDSWTYAVEGLTVRGSKQEILEALSLGQGEALSLCYTQTISTILYARGGRLLAGFDMTVPHIRFGSDQHYFDPFLASAGFAADLPARSAGARLVKLAFGITITPDLLEKPLAAAALPAFDH
jgi:hypothetical protein